MNGPVLKCMQEIQFECYKLRTRNKPAHEGSPRAGGRARPWGCLSLSSSQVPPPPPPPPQQQQQQHCALLFCPNTDTARQQIGPEASPGIRPRRWVLRSGAC
jgi:hypothetical protein